MYTRGDLVEDYTTGNVYLREIFKPDGTFLCYTMERSGMQGAQDRENTAELLHCLNFPERD